MFIIKNSYISHCGKKPPPAHCAPVVYGYNEKKYDYCLGQPWIPKELSCIAVDENAV